MINISILVYFLYIGTFESRHKLIDVITDLNAVDILQNESCSEIIQVIFVDGPCSGSDYEMFWNWMYPHLVTLIKYQYPGYVLGSMMKNGKSSLF